MLKIRLAAPLQSDSILDGEGIRTIVWTQGCAHNCPFCHNPETHSFKGGSLEDIETLKKQFKELKGQTGITFSGGDPMFQPKECAVLANYAISIGLDVWCYTGFTFEELLDMAKKNKDIIDFLNNIDILVDGKFMIELKSYDVIFRGSTNQRIIDVKESLKSSSIVLAEKYIKENKSTNFRHQDNIYV